MVRTHAKRRLLEATGGATDGGRTKVRAKEGGLGEESSGGGGKGGSGGGGKGGLGGVLGDVEADAEDFADALAGAMDEHDGYVMAVNAASPNSDSDSDSDSSSSSSDSDSDSDSDGDQVRNKLPYLVQFVQTDDGMRASPVSIANLTSSTFLVQEGQDATAFGDSHLGVLKSRNGTLVAVSLRVRPEDGAVLTTTKVMKKNATKKPVKCRLASPLFSGCVTPSSLCEFVSYMNGVGSAGKPHLTFLKRYAKMVLKFVTRMDFVAVCSMFVVASTEMPLETKRAFLDVVKNAMNKTACTMAQRQDMYVRLSETLRAAMTKRADEVVQFAENLVPR